MLIQLAQEAQIAWLIAKKDNIQFEYLNFVDIFLKQSATKLFKHFDINKYLINLGPDKQLYYDPIYSLELVKLETLKTYIKTNLANGFIWPSKSPAKASILFIKKPNSSFCLYID